jgi:SpoVK/Ycf46/Vps4 family AAA+-type ATPase
MGSHLSGIQLSLTTLLPFSLLPYVFFVYSHKFDNNHRYLMRANLFFSLSLIGSMFFLAARMFPLMGSRTVGTELLLTFLHLLPLGVALILALYSGLSIVGMNPSRNKPLNRDVEKLSWDDLVIPTELREELASIIELLRAPAKAKEYGIEVPKGILLEGPPGTGKTTIAKVIANQAGLSFFVLRLDEVISKWVGDSEKNLTSLFESAKACAPAVLFIDEIDSIGKQRSGSSGQEHRESFLNHLLQLMDGVIKTEGLYIIAATNRADLVDAALKRPGRLNKVIEVGLPDVETRRKLFELYLAKLKLADFVDIQTLCEITEDRSPAEIREICNQAGLNAFRRESANGRRTGLVTAQDIEMALVA